MREKKIEHNAQNKIIKEREEKIKLEQARKDYQQRVIAQMKVEEKRQEQEKIRQKAEDEQRQRRQKQEEISR